MAHTTKDDIIKAAINLARSAAGDKWPKYEAWQALQQAVKDYDESDDQLHALKDCRLKLFALNEGYSYDEITQNTLDEMQDLYSFDIIEEDSAMRILKEAYEIGRKFGLRQAADFAECDLALEMSAEELADAILQILPPRKG